MPMILNIVLPVTVDGYSVYANSDDEEVSSAISSVSYVNHNGNRVDADKNHRNAKTDTISENRQSCRTYTTKSSEVVTGTRKDKVHMHRRDNQLNSQKRNQQSRPCQVHHRQPQQHTRHGKRQQQARKTILPQTQHQISKDSLTHGHVVVLENSTRRARSSSAAPRIMEPSNEWQQRQRALRDVRLSVTDSYDIDLEHSDIMMKALKSYSQHCRLERDDIGSNPGSVNDRMRKINASIPHNERLSALSGVTPRYRCTGHFNQDSSTREPMENSRVVKMSQCRLRFYDDVVDTGTQISKNSKSNPSSLPHNSPLLYTLENGDGVLADAMGHVYISKQTRSWSALPEKLCDLMKVNREGLYHDGDRRLQDTARSNINNDNKTISPSSNSPSNQPKVQVPTFSNNMSQPMTHSLAYQKRNQTTHMWTDSSQLMSQSVPSASFLHRSFGSSFSSPRSSRDDSSVKTSPAGKTTRTRPSSSYSYDGGFFVGAHSGQAEYFVIHPDWVSESMTVKKLPMDDKKAGSPIQRSASLSARILSDGRRCLSAPPKQRNPITMDHNELSHKTSN